MFKILDWIDINKLDWRFLSSSENTPINFLKQNENKINWSHLSENSNAMELLEKNKDKIDWKYLSVNRNAIKLLEQNQEKIDWNNLSRNLNAIKLLEKNQEKINWKYLSFNPYAVELLKKNKDKIHWLSETSNLNSTEWIKKYQDIVEESTYHLFTIDNELNFAGQYKSFWICLSKNENEIKLLKENQDKINWIMFSQNRNIFTYDYQLMKKTMKDSGIAEELMAYIFNPKNMEKWIDWGFTEHQEIIEFIN